MKTAMILAAGRGERLKPITNYKPKALCEIKNIPLIEYHISKLSLLGIQRIIINHAHLGAQIRRQVGNGSRFGVEICYAPEPPGGLETGGGIVNALSLLGSEPFLTVNADIYTDFSFSELTLPEKSLIHLILVSKPSYRQQGDFGLCDQQVNNQDKQYIFSGIACHHPSAFAHLTPGRYSVTPLIRQYADQGKVTGELYTGQWADIGSPDRLREFSR